MWRTGREKMEGLINVRVTVQSQKLKSQFFKGFISLRKNRQHIETCIDEQISKESSELG